MGIASRPKSPTVGCVWCVSRQESAMDRTDPNSPWFRFVWVDPERLGGTPCFRNSRVPIKALFDYLETGRSLAEFLADFPPVTREQAESVVRLAAQGLIKASAA